MKDHELRNKSKEELINMHKELERMCAILERGVKDIRTKTNMLIADIGFKNERKR